MWAKPASRVRIPPAPPRPPLNEAPKGAFFIGKMTETSSTGVRGNPTQSGHFWWVVGGVGGLGMPRKARELSPLEVGRLIKPGRWSVGGVDGLALQVTATGARSWVLRLSAAGRRHEMGLGSFPSVTLAAAREKARRHRSLADEGADPVAARRALRSADSAEQLAQSTFTEVAAQYIAQHEKSWKNAKHQAQWTATLRTYAEPSIGKLLVRDIRPAHVIGVLEPIWTTKTETATRVRSRG